MRKTHVLLMILAIGISAILVVIPILNASPNYVISDFKVTCSFTTAVCNEKNFCQDNEVFCNDKNIVQIVPITRSFIQFSSSWKDPRTDEQKKIVC